MPVSSQLLPSKWQFGAHNQMECPRRDSLEMLWGPGGIAVVTMVQNSLGTSVTFNDLLSSFDSTFRKHFLPKLGKLNIDSRLLTVPWSSYHITTPRIQLAGMGS